MTAPVSTGNAVPPFPVAANIVPVRLIVYTNANKHVAYLNAISRSSTITLARLASMFESFTNGSFRSNVDISTNGVNATTTVTLLSGLANNDTCTINGVVITAATTGNGTTSFTIGTTLTISAANMVATINANTTLLNQVFAQSTGAVVTLTCRVPGTIGNLCTVTESAHFTVSANFTGGADGTQSNNSHGL